MILEGVQLQSLKIIPGELGTIYHALKKQETAFSSFGEAYFSSVNYQAIKGWKLHTQMISNLVVPIGSIRFVLYDPRPNSNTYKKFMDITLSPSNYKRLTIPPGIWLSFQGISQTENILLNIASIPHDPKEAEQLPIDTPEIPFTEW